MNSPNELQRSFCKQGVDGKQQLKKQMVEAEYDPVQGGPRQMLHDYPLTHSMSFWVCW